MHRHRRMRALGESAGSGRLTQEQPTGEEPDETVGALGMRGPSTDPDPSTHREDEAAARRRSPFPYAEKFEEWVADETGSSDVRQHRRKRGDADD